jgi:uncharacterized PurR-regulated membrane protein YhhQ (DUF165 family)
LSELKLIITERRERTFLVLAGIFLSAMTLLNVVGITRFIQLGPLALAVGVLPYPLTFLCTDLISELYGRARANFLVSVGLGINFLILGVLTLGSVAPSVPQDMMPANPATCRASNATQWHNTGDRGRPVPTDLCDHIGCSVCVDVGLYRRSIL